MKKLCTALSLLIIVLSCSFVFAGCGEEKAPLTSDTLYVRKVENLTDDFIFGMDSSCVPSLENSGVKFYDYNGEEADVFKILSDAGINYIRVRVWVDPYDKNGNGYGGGNCDIDNAVEIGKRATKYGMKLLVDFHYSDFWADPNKQFVPKAWADMEIDEKADALREYTRESLTKLKEAKVDVGMVQIGNETNGAMCGETIWMNICNLMAAGAAATREIMPDALIAVHFTNPEMPDNLFGYAKKLDYYGVDYDVFASSYYPFWHGSLDNLADVLSRVAETYDKKVMVGETSYPYTPDDSDFSGNTVGDGGTFAKNYPFTPQGQANSITDIVDTIVNKTTNGIGVFYWEGTWITVGTSSYEENFVLWEKYGSGWATSYAGEYDPNDAGKYYGGCSFDNQTFFDPDGKPLESLKVFSLMKNGNEVERRPDAMEDINLIVDLSGDIVLPTEVNAVMNDDSRESVPVVWEKIDEEMMKSNGTQTYDIVGNAGGMQAHCYVSMVEKNFLENYGFETGDDSFWIATKNKEMNELYVEDKLSDSLTGSYHYHFWSEAADSVDFTLEQEVHDLPSGKYRYSISIMGGDAGDTDIFAYVKINGETVKTAPLGITTYGNWDTAAVTDIEYNKGDTITVGISVKCSGAGAWGKIDDAALNSVSE